MASKYRYLEEMKESGYHNEAIDGLHYRVMTYLSKLFFPKKDSNIVDIGAGWGHCLIPLKSLGYKNLNAIDIDQSASKVFKNSNINFIKADMESDKLPFEDSTIDVVLSFYVVAHLNDPTNYLSEISRILKPGGLIMIVTPDWRKQYKTFWRDHTHVHPYDKVGMQRLLRCFKFDIILVRSFGVIRGIGRLKLWKLFNGLIFTGRNLIAIARKL